MPRPVPASVTLVAVIASALAVACTTTPAKPRTPVPPPPAPAESINAQVSKLSAIPWAVKRPLAWTDFKATPPKEASAAAETAYTIFHGIRCVGSVFEFRVVAAFRPADSWVRPAVLRSPADNARALRHEQTHFDLAEVHARRMRRYFSELVAPCRTPADELSATADRFVQDEHNAQTQYDVETDHSRIAAQQAKWDKDVDGQLIALAKYASAAK